MIHRLDYPPIWLLVALGLAWTTARVAPVWAGAGATSAGVAVLGWTLVAAGALLMAAAALQFLRHRTTIVPHRDPTVLITGGIYRLSRNPIYLADVALLAGAIMIWQAWLALPLIPALALVLQRRFIDPEEARLRTRFGAAADTYFASTRRWL